MAFPTSLPTRDADWLQPHISSVELHEYAFQLLRYYDQQFGSHPHFQYYLLKMIMRYQSHATAVVFINKHLHDNSPTTTEKLCHQLSNLPNNKLVEHLMQFGSSLIGTREYWTKCRSELTDMIT